MSDDYTSQLRDRRDLHQLLGTGSWNAACEPTLKVRSLTLTSLTCSLAFFWAAANNSSVVRSLLRESTSFCDSSSPEESDDPEADEDVDEEVEEVSRGSSLSPTLNSVVETTSLKGPQRVRPHPGSYLNRPNSPRPRSAPPASRDPATASPGACRCCEA